MTTRYGASPVVPLEDRPVEGGLVERDGREWYAIRRYDRMAPFFISLVSPVDHWWFVSSTGGMTAGRVDADHAFLPYETEDKIASAIAHTGPLTLLRVHGDEGTQLWEPFRTHVAAVHRVERTLLKSVEGDALIFEERNEDLELTLSMTLRTGDRVGFVRTMTLEDHGGSARRVDLLDGYRNVLPHGATKLLQTRMSSLLDAYKRSEIDAATGVAFFSLSSTLTDRAEASEALRANVLWSLGLEPEAVLLTPDARVDAFRLGEDVPGDTDVRGHRGAYLVRASFELGANAQRRWHTIADVAKDAKGAGRVRVWQRDLDAAAREALLEEDVEASRARLRAIVGRADGLQVGADRLTTTHHFANTLFNVMRGGVFMNGDTVEVRDFTDFLGTRNEPVRERHAGWLAALPSSLPIQDLFTRAEATEDVDLVRLVLEYLPLAFSRRHGDPSRPWNEFAIRLRNPDGTPRTDYQGNWRDIFQNWEPLAYAYPAFAFSMVAKFLNATTRDGYNPYRVTRDGIEWEEPEPDDPWSNLGYWGDHQIVYLQKLLEAVERLEPGRLRREWSRAGFSYADVPYRIAGYEAILADWSDTITFDEAANRAAHARVAAMGTDGKLVPSPAGGVHHVTMVEKLLVLLLAKLTNLVPGGGIWMNTQRPEWNDANNALVGKGVSVVTAAYLRRFVVFWQGQLAAEGEGEPFTVAAPVVALARVVSQALGDARAYLGTMDDGSRRALMDALGAAGGTYRAKVYEELGASATLEREELAELLDHALAHLDHTLATSRREDGLFHAYSVLELEEETARVRPLQLMLEGQVAGLSAGFLAPDEAVRTLEALRASALYWPEQRTYLLYPNRELPGFLEKNAFPAEWLEDSALAAALARHGDDRLVLVDPFEGRAHFGGDLRNAGDVAALFDRLAKDPRYPTADAERRFYLELFEKVFDHASFTGRSGTFFAYEGLGSVYWHMVSKLLLAVQECFFDAVDRGHPAAERLRELYDDVRAGLGFRKSPAAYGAFPTDPYSHTPETGGARQPGMTGVVKEELLTRMGELGLRVSEGELRFEPHLLEAKERLEGGAELPYVDVAGKAATVSVPAGGLAFTFAQTPVVYEAPGEPAIRVRHADGSEETVTGATLPRALSERVLARDGSVRALHVTTRAGR